MADMTSMLKLKVKRIYRFCSRGGLTCLSMQGVFRSVKWKLSNSCKSNSTKKVYWIGAFSPIHGNVGDHAQTLGVRRFLRDHFGDYKIITIYRDDVSAHKLRGIAEHLRPQDIVFLHSSGDFGSMHDVANHHSGSISYPEVRRQIVKYALSQNIINLPVTAYYQDDEKGKVSLQKDQDAFDQSRFTVLCRELVSLQVVQSNLQCESMFFPDFVFYLEPKPIAVPRKGVLTILRNDKEAVLDKKQKSLIIEKLKSKFSDVFVKDIMHEYHVIPDFILDEYMERVFEQFQGRELVITDKMHGMITAVITGTPCIALSGGIPHKILAYKPFLAGAVEFVENIAELEAAIDRVKEREFNPVDLTEYFETFREHVLEHSQVA